MVDLHSARREYAGEPIPGDIDSPWPLFEQWFDQARQAERDGALIEPAAMTVVTVDADGQPSARVLLLKAFDAERGEHGSFDFYSHATSRKGIALEHNPRIALLLYWPALNRQVRIEGTVTTQPAAEAEAYWHERPKASQVAAVVSHQSHPRDSRASLEAEFAAATAEYADREVPCPPDWRGYRVSPHRFEFWQGLPGRLHDRVACTLQPDEAWFSERLDP
ncbi:pyridoxamine 5'-phosphate oxidase [Propionibacteriaceae bacterium Y1923]|uniref:pyridoxamine 5'-phosphate oxidase n=1 Tax=Aestuariimicrobium sp. Y1814 TaxID=3418742 RepID=UPI003C2141BF